jgi:hypothetical protein
MTGLARKLSCEGVKCGFESTLEDLVCRMGGGCGLSPIVLEGEPRRGTIPKPLSGPPRNGSLTSSEGGEVTSDSLGELRREEGEAAGLPAGKGRGRPRPPDRRFEAVDVTLD